MPFRKAMLTLAALSLVLVSTLPAHAQSATTTKSTTTTSKSSSVGMAKSSMKSTATTTVKAKMVDINTATKEELEALPGIGDAIADKIIANRPFANKHQLVSKKLVNSAQYSAMAPHIVASGGMATPAGATKKTTTSTAKKTSTTK